MRHKLLFSQFLSCLALTLLSFGRPATSFAQTADHLLVTQVYGGGGSSSSTASYKNDFIEIFNAGTTSVDLSAYSVQYGPAGSDEKPSVVFSGITTLSSASLSGGVLAPGQYYLIAEGSTGTGGADLTGADITGTINLAASSGKVALVKGTTLLGSATAGCSDTSIVSLVGYGTLSSSTCAAGGNAAPATSVNTSALRTNSCTDTGDNRADFTVGPTTAPRNSSTTPAPCSGGGGSTTYASISSSVADPSSVKAGDSTTLLVTVAPNTSTGITVTADLSNFSGGSATQNLTAISATSYSLSFAVPAATVAGNYSIPIRVADSASHTSTASIALTVTQPTTITSISTLQSSRGTYVNTSITTSGVVTGVGPAGFFVQTPSSTPGSTGFSEGIYVYSGTGKVPSAATVGNLVEITGTLSLYPAATASHTPALEVTGATITVDSTRNPLPSPIPLSALNLTSSGGLYQLTRYESMRVSMASMTSTSGTDGYFDANGEAGETYVSSGEFYTVFTGTARPYREPGIDVRDFPASLDLNSGPWVTEYSPSVTYSSKPAMFDDNPERILVDSDFLGHAPIDLSTGAIVTGAVGILDFTYSSDSYSDPARFLLAADSAPSVTPGMSAEAVPAAGQNQFTVVAFNVERFFNPSSADNLYYNAGTGKTGGSSAVNVTADAYARRLKKVSLAIRTILNSPDIISLEEIENQSVAQDIAAQVNSDAVAAGQENPNYVGYGVNSADGTYTDDIGGISVGFLVKTNTVNVAAKPVQYGEKDVVPSGTTLNDRPPYVLHAGIKRQDATDYPITVIANHLRSLSGIATSANTRLKKELQAEALASLINTFQAAGEHVIALGDFNAFEFSDAYTDTLATITNTNVLPEGVVAQPGKADLVTPAPVDLVTLLPQEQRWSYVEYGNAQVLDHVVATQDLVTAGTYLTYAHLDADFPVVLANDPTSPARISDHDAAVTYVPLPLPTISATLLGNGAFGSVTVNTSSTGSQFTLTNTGEGTLTLSAIEATGNFAQTNNCGTTLLPSASCSINVVFTPTATGPRTGLLNITSNTSLASVALSGTGISNSPQITLGSLSAIYDGTPHAATATATPEGLDVTITYNGSANPPTAADSYRVIATAKPSTGLIISAVGTLVIAQAPLTVSATDASRVYGSANPAFTGSVTGAVQGDTLTPVFSTTATEASPAGTYPITSSVTGTSAANYSLTLKSGTLTVTRASTTTALSVSANTPAPGVAVTLTAVVASVTTGIPTGAVTFFDNGNPVGTAALASGSASVSETPSAGASHVITASYAGDGNFLASDTGTTITVPGLTYSFVNSGGSTVTVARGAVAPFTFQATPTYGVFPGTVSFSVAGLPANTSASFSPATLAASAGPTAVTMTVTTTASTGVTASSRLRQTALPIAAAALFLPLLGLRRFRGTTMTRLLLLLVIVGGFFGAAALSGCGDDSSHDDTSSPASYTLTVTSTSGAIQQSQTVTLNVQ